MGMKEACARISHGAHAETSGDAYLHAALRRRQVALRWSDNAAADVHQVSFGPLPYAIRMRLAKLLPSIAVTAHDTTYATITVGYDDGAAGGVTSLQAVTSKITGGTGNWVAGTAIALSSIGAEDTVAAGKYLTVTVAKASTGVVSAGSVFLDFDYE